MKKPTQVKQRRKHESTQPKVSRDVLPINPDFFYRLIEGPKYFGYQLTTQDEKIRTGEIPAPVHCRSVDVRRPACQQMSTSEIPLVKDGILILPRMSDKGGYYMECCSCELMHRLDFTIRDGKLELRVYRTTNEERLASLEE